MFNQKFQFAPIGTHDTKIIIDVFKRIPNQKDTISKLGPVRVDLRELESQETQSFSKNLRDNTYDLTPSKAHDTESVLNFNARFQYSKILYCKNNIAVLTDELQSIENEIALLKSRNPHLS